MKASLIALALFAASGAFANEASDDLANRAAFAGGATRAEVKADTLAAKQSGALQVNEYQANQQPTVKAGRSRTQARAEAVQAARSHTVHELY
jgi:hypothetical protein